LVSFSWGCFRYRAPSRLDLPACPLGLQALPYRGFHPSCLLLTFRPIRNATRDLCCPGVCPLRAAPADSSPTAPSLPLVSAPLTEFPRLPWHRSSTSRSSSTRRCWVPSRFYPQLDLAPLFRFHPPLGPGSPPWRTPAEAGELLPLMVLVLRALTSPKRSPRFGPLACSVLRGRRFGARLRDLPPYSRFRAFDPLTQLSRRYQSLEVVSWALAS
jgi:hypothetical protein